MKLSILSIVFLVFLTGILKAVPVDLIEADNIAEARLARDDQDLYYTISN